MAEPKAQALDDQGMSAPAGRELLRRLRDAGFNADDAQLPTDLL